MLVARRLKFFQEIIGKHFSPKTFNSDRGNDILVPSILSVISPSQYRWTSSDSKPVKTPEAKAAEEKKNAKRKQTHIALIHPDKTITHTTLEDATKLSNRRDLKLVKVSDYDRKRDSPLYQLMTAVQFREETLSLKKSKEDKKGPYKGEKLLAINSKIGDHDLESKLQKMVSWLEKTYTIRVTISASKPGDMAMTEKVFEKIESFVGRKGRILQKRNSESDIKFQIAPPKQPKSTKTDSAITEGAE